MKQQQGVSILAPGFAGLNLQDSPAGISPTFALIADNCVIDKYGRIGSRKGWTSQTTSGSTQLSGNPIEFIHEHVNADDSYVVISGGNSKLFTGGVGSGLTDISPSLYTISANNWKGATSDGLCVIVQDGHEPLVYDSTATPVCQTMTDYTTLTQSYGTSYPKDILSAYGRLWAHDGKTIYWSTDIADAAFPAFYDGSSGTLNIASVLPDNTDTIVALEAHNNFLIIFCKNNIVLFNSADNVLSTNFAVNDVITGVGCIARDSIQKTGNDIIFLSGTGVRSLGRLIQEKSLPMRDLTKNVRDQLLQIVDYELSQDSELKGVKSVYSETQAFYLLTFPSYNRAYVLDMRQALQDGSARVTVWQQFPVKALTRRRNRDILLGFIDTIGKYEGYTDNGSAYSMRAYSSFLDLDSSSVLKLVKRIKATIIGGANQRFIVKLGYDFIGSTYSVPFVIADNGPYEYGTDEYMDAQYTAGIAVEVINAPGMGSGNTVQLGFESVINGAPISIQKIDLFVISGKSS